VRYCKKCDQSKEVVEFGKDKQTKDGFNFYCKECIRNRNKNRDPQKVYEYNIQWKEKNKEKVINYSRNHFKNNKEICLKKGRESYHRHKEEIAKRRKILRSSPEAKEANRLRTYEWRQKNKSKCNSSVRNWQIRNRIKIRV